jgi:membrane protease YdiL (CAAX protease family)
MQLLLFLLMAFTFMSSVGAIIFGVFTKLTGFLPAQLAGIHPGSPAALIKATIVVQGVQNMFVYMLPALTFAYLAHPEPAAYLGLRKPGKSIQILLAVLLMTGAMPMLIMIENWMGLINFGKDIKAAQAANDNVFKAFLQMNSFVDFLRVFVVVAIIPAIGEELFFRGVLMRFARKRSRTMVFPIMFTAVVFSYSHANIYGYLSIFLAGVLLAVIYNLTGSIWCSIAGHLFFNGTQITLHYLGGTDGAVKTFLDNNTVPYSIVAAGALLFGASLYLLIRYRTPLPPNWSDDFTPDELSRLPGSNTGNLF